MNLPFRGYTLRFRRPAAKPKSSALSPNRKRRYNPERPWPQKETAIAAKHGPSTLRIGSGRWSGRKLLPPSRQAETRPITAAAKKSLFGILRPRLAGATVLDLYCGTGTLGLEAMSNGASYCCFADRDPRVVERLLRNIETCHAGSDAHVWTGYVDRSLPDWLDELQAMGREVDLAFVDPPYAAARTWQWDKLIAKVFSPLGQAMRPDAMVVLRLPDDVDAPETLGPLTLQRMKTYGKTMDVGFYQRKAETTDPA